MNEGLQEYLENLKGYHSAFYEKICTLVSEVPLGTCIVELGTGTGNSSFLYRAMANENVEIFTFDDYDERRLSWLSQPENGDLEKVFMENINKTNARINFCRIKIEDAVQRWIRAIGFLSWDIGQKDRFREDFEDWSRFVVLGGVVIVKDMPGNKFGTFEVVKELEESLKWKRFDYIGGVSFLRRMK